MSVIVEQLCLTEADTEAQAKRFAQILQPGDSVGLQGDLGAGKTFFASALTRALGYQGETHSPSYALIHEYPGLLAIFHADLYRLPQGADWEEIGLDEYFHRNGILLIEWPERLPEAKKLCRYWVELAVKGENSRHLRITQQI